MRVSSGSAPEQRHVCASAASAIAAALAEDGSSWPQFGADVGAHVLDDAEHRHVDLLEHAQALARIGSAMSCGVVTITAPATGTRCASVSCMSPVPGGMSTTR